MAQFSFKQIHPKIVSFGLRGDCVECVVTDHLDETDIRSAGEAMATEACTADVHFIVLSGTLFRQSVTEERLREYFGARKIHLFCVSDITGDHIPFIPTSRT